MRAFFDWWRRELIAAIPPALREDPVLRRRGIVFQLGDDAIRIDTLSEGSRQEIGTVAAMPAAPEAERRAIEALVPPRRGASEIGLVLADVRVLRKTLEFPATAERDLEAIIANQIDRVTPYRAAQVRFASRILARDRAHRRLTVELVAVAIADVAAALERLGACGVKPAFLWVEASCTATPIAIALTPRHEAGAKRRNAPLLPALAGLNAILLLAAIGIPLWDRHAEEARLRDQVAAAKLRADSVIALRGKVEALRAELAALSDRQTRLPVIAIALNELTRAIPDGTWVEELRIGPTGLDMRGQSPQASAMIGATESIPMFRNVEFRAPVTRDGMRGAERFHISAEYSVGARP